MSLLDRSRLSRRAALRAAGAAGLAIAGRLGPAGVTRAQAKASLTWLTDLPHADMIAAKFGEANPDIEVKVETVTFREVFQQNQVRLGSGSDSPDVVSVDAPLVASYGLRGWLQPLDDSFSPDQRAAWVDAQLASGTYDGKLLAPPIWNSSQLLLYNLDLFDKAGVKPPGPEERWTWEQIAGAARSLTQGDVWGFQFEQYNRIYQLQPLPQGKGAPVIGEDGLSVKGVVDSQPWIDAFTWFGNLHNAWKVAPQGSNIEVSDLFQNQKLAMCVRGPWAIKEFIDAKLPFQWRAAPHPHWENGKVLVPTDSWHLGVNAKSQHVAEATRFVQFASSIDAGKPWFDTGAMWPCQQALLDQIIGDPANKEWPGLAYTIAAKESQYAEPRPKTPGYLEYEEILSDAFEDIRNGADVAQSLSGAASRIDREMQKYRNA